MREGLDHLDGVPKPPGMAAGEPLGEEPAKLAPGEGTSGQQLAADLSHLVQVQAVDLARVVRMPDRTRDDRLDGRPKPTEVVGPDQVHRPPDHGASHDATLLEQFGKVASAEAGNTGPETDVRPVRLLALNGHQSLEHRGNGQVGSPQQELALEKRPIERAVRQHARTLAIRTDIAAV